MATLHIFSTVDELDIPITSMADLKAHMPNVPESPSIFQLDSSDLKRSITLTYGTPDANQARVTDLDNAKVSRQQFRSFQAATSAFLHLASSAL